MSEQREPDHSDDPRGQEVGDGYPEVQPDDNDQAPDEEQSEDEE